METGAVVFGSLIAGAIFGAIPAVVGYKRGKKGLAVAGFVTCVIGSFLLGMFLSIPACIIFTIIIVISKDSPVNSNTNVGNHSTYTSSQLKKCTQCGNLMNINETFCSKCGAKQIAEVKPNYCPSCGKVIQEGTIFCNNCGAKTR